MASPLNLLCSETRRDTPRAASDAGIDGIADQFRYPMHTTPELDGVFPLSGGSAERARLRAPQLALLVKSTPGGVLGHRAFMRAWSARRMALAAAAAGHTAAAPAAAEPAPVGSG